MPAEGAQTDMFSRVQTTLKSDALMAAMGKINRKMGKESIKLASEEFKRPWKMKQGNKNPGYTTNWMDLTVVI